MTVLVVDNQPEIRSILRDYLSRHGFDVLEAANGLEAFTQVKERRPAIVILDLAMPRLGGLEALKRMRELAPAATVIVVSGLIDGDTRRAALALGAHAVFDKPVLPSELLAAMGGPRPPRATAGAASTTPPTRAGAAPARGRVLVVDDEEAIRSAFQDYLLAHGYEVGVARDADVALRVMAQERVDVVLLDVELPGLNGVDALPVIRGAAPGVKVIMVSGSDDPDVIRRVLARGAFDYVIKPVDWPYMIGTIETAVAMKRMESPAGVRP